MLGKLQKILAVWTLRTVLVGVRLFWRVRYVDRPDDTQRPHLYAHRHGDELLLLPVFAHRNYAVMTSRSRDGEWMTELVKSLGYFVVRGSSSRGGAGGLKGLIDAVRTRRLNAAIAIDGPRGPVGVVKPGILGLAQATGFPIVPAACAASRPWWIPGAWNEGYVPKPFSQCVVVFGEAIEVAPDATEDELEACRQLLERRLRALRVRAEAEVSPSNSRVAPFLPISDR